MRAPATRLGLGLVLVLGLGLGLRLGLGSWPESVSGLVLGSRLGYELVLELE